MKTKYRILQAKDGWHWIQRYDSQWFNFRANYWYNIGNSETLEEANRYLHKYKYKLLLDTVYEEDFYGKSMLESKQKGLS